MQRIFLPWLICLILLSACGNDDDDVVDPIFPSKGKIVFVSNRDGDEQIYVMDADGSNAIKLTDVHDEEGNPTSAAPHQTSTAHGEFNLYPDWSPDGTKIAFVSTRDGNNEIYVMNADGSNPTNLTNHSASDLFPIWSPDGTKIAFVSGRDGNAEIYVIDADGANPVNITNNPANDTTPSWSSN